MTQYEAFLETVIDDGIAGATARGVFKAAEVVAKMNGCLSVREG